LSPLFVHQSADNAADAKAADGWDVFSISLFRQIGSTQQYTTLNLATRPTNLQPRVLKTAEKVKLMKKHCQ